jgi:Predicted membrane protein
MSTPIELLLNRRRILRFAGVGTLGTVIDLSVTATLVYALAVLPAIAKVIGAELAIVVMFVINDRWTFRAFGPSQRRSRLLRLARSNGVRLGGIALQFLVVGWLLRSGLAVPVGGVDLGPMVAAVIAIGLAASANYLGESLLTWRITQAP